MQCAKVPKNLGVVMDTDDELTSHVTIKKLNSAYINLKNIFSLTCQLD